MRKERISDILHDIAVYHMGLAIHLERGTHEQPIQLLDRILDNVERNYYELNLIIDNNLLTNADLSTLRDRGFIVNVRKSHAIPGIHLADILAGAFRFHHTGNPALLNIVLDHICEFSSRSLCNYLLIGN